MCFISLIFTRNIVLEIVKFKESNAVYAQEVECYHSNANLNSANCFSRDKKTIDWYEVLCSNG